MIAVDIVSLLIGWSAAWPIGHGDTPFMTLSTGIGMIAIGLVASIVCFSAARLYRTPINGIRSGALGRLLQSMGVAAMVTIVWQAVLDDVVPGLVLRSVTAALVATTIVRYGFDVWLISRRAATAPWPQPPPTSTNTIEISVRDRHHQAVDLQGQRWLLRH